uniref:Terpene synthase N-terminal domain-containing protein n=1 Tax=Oryza sativa subsp. japonica TaxID=39947 RepID=Q6F2Q2_ORYSJ|nr:hypothetical protein [Oryza sativa Japonica Group]
MAEKLKRDVRILFGTCNDILEKMNLIDAVHRLGIDHLFQEEIGSAISDIKGSEFTSSSLHEVALWFRLLREHGIWVSPGDSELHLFALILWNNFSVSVRTNHTTTSVSNCSNCLSI